MHWWSCCVHRWFWKSWEEDEKASGEFRARLWAYLSLHELLVLLCTSLILAVMKGG